MAIPRNGDRLAVICRLFHNGSEVIAGIGVAESGHDISFVNMYRILAFYRFVNIAYYGFLSAINS